MPVDPSTAPDKLARLTAAIDRLSDDDRRDVQSLMLGYLSGVVTGEQWDAALGMGLRIVGRDPIVTTGLPRSAESVGG